MLLSKLTEIFKKVGQSVPWRLKYHLQGAVCSQGATSHSKQVSDSRAHMLHNVPSKINLKKYQNSFHNNCTIIKIAMIQYIHKKIEEKSSLIITTPLLKMYTQKNVGGQTGRLI